MATIKETSRYKIDSKCMDGRRYEDFKNFIEENPDMPVVLIDTVEGTKGGACLLTVHFTVPTFMIAFRREYNDAQSVIDIFNDIYNHISISRRPLPEYLLIDEVYAFKSVNSKYVCVLVDFKTQNIVDVLPSRRKQTLMDYFFSIPLEERKNVKIVSFDMWETYRIVSKIMFPNAICATDHFHVKQEFGRKIDRVRIDVMNKYYSRKKYLEKKKEKTKTEKLELREASKHYYALKKFNWMLFSNDNRIFDPNEKKIYNHTLEGYYNYYDILDFMVRHDPVLDLAYDLKYELDEFYSRSNEKNALKNIEELIISFRNSQIKEMMDFGNTLVKWKTHIKRPD